MPRISEPLTITVLSEEQETLGGIDLSFTEVNLSDRASVTLNLPDQKIIIQIGDEFKIKGRSFNLHEIKPITGERYQISLKFTDPDAFDAQLKGIPFSPTPVKKNSNEIEIRVELMRHLQKVTYDLVEVPPRPVDEVKTILLKITAQVLALLEPGFSGAPQGQPKFEVSEKYHKSLHPHEDDLGPDITKTEIHKFSGDADLTLTVNELFWAPRILDHVSISASWRVGTSEAHCHFSSKGTAKGISREDDLFQFTRTGIPGIDVLLLRRAS